MISLKQKLILSKYIVQDTKNYFKKFFKFRKIKLGYGFGKILTNVDRKISFS